MDPRPGDLAPAMATRQPITPQLLDCGIVAILRGTRDDRLPAVAETLLEAGFRCLELTLTTPGALDALRALRPLASSGVAIGMGTVLSGGQAQAALDAGADFLVSPGVSPEVAAVAAGARVACYPGAWTPTEILEAWRLRVPAVKLFPAGTGGPAHLRHLRGPLPDVPLVPTGGIGLDEIAAYFAAGAAAVGVGGPLIGDALDGGSLAALRDRARAAHDAVAEGRGQ